jgi:hypothetical protein
MKSVDINQRIPLYVLESLLQAYYNDSYSNDYALEQLRLEFTGENRLKKSLRLVNKIIVSNPIQDFMISNKNLILPALKSAHDRHIILISLLSSSFSFSFHLLSLLGKYFSVQEMVSREVVSKGMMSLYGGNRATPNAIDSVIPMFLEGELFSRPKPGLYQFKSPKELKFDISRSIFTESFRLNKSEKIDEWGVSSDPYFFFINSR